MAGCLISFEGIDGSGKTTALAHLFDYLKDRGLVEGKDFIQAREPGGTETGLAIRELLLRPSTEGMSDTCELLLYEAARANLCERVILPALTSGKLVLMDRFYDSTCAYQAYGRRLDLALVDRANSLATSGLAPHLTILFDCDVKRAAARRADRAQDRIEAAGIAFIERVAQGYLALAEREPSRWRVLDANQDEKSVAHDLIELVEPYLATYIRDVRS